MLAGTPNLYAFNDAGSALGYSYMKIRGFDDKRVSTYINGVPLNDPEDQATYFVDLPDFTSNVTDIQVQRGVGNSMYGDASFGGSVNIATNAFNRQRSACITAGYGEYTSGGNSVSDIYKQSVEYSSGLVDGRWLFGGRFSKQKSGGYRHDSWYHGWAYYLSVARLDPNMWTELHLYGGPMKMHLSYSGATLDQLARDHRANPYHTYSNETDNFNQPHYQLHNVYKLSETATLSNTFYYIRGRGYYEQYKDDEPYEEYNIPASLTDGAEEGDVVRQQWVEKSQYGWNPRLEVKHDHGRRTIGGSLYYFESDHWGQVVWVQGIEGTLDDGFDPQHRYYQYYGKKWHASVFAQEERELTDCLNLTATAQVRYQKYDFDQAKMGAFKGYQYDVDWLFFSPRLELSYKVNEQLSLHSFAAISSRTPTDASIYDANDPYILPSLEIESMSVSGNDTSYVFGDPTASCERVIDLELGGEYRAKRFAVGLNLFYMDFSDEIIPEGGINENTGLAITTNADRSVHTGVELTGTVQVVEPIKIEGNLAVNYNRVKDYVGQIDVYDDNWDLVDRIDYDYKDKTIAGFPNVLGNVAVQFERDDLQTSLRLQYIGKQFVELMNVDSLAIDPHVIASWSTSLRMRNFMGFGDFTIKVSIENLFDDVYETSGYGWSYAMGNPQNPTYVHEAEYYPAAERWFWGQIKWELF